MPAAENAARTFHEEFQKAVFGWPQLEGLTAPLNLVGDRIELDIANLDCFASKGRANAAHDRSYTRQQFARRKRLGEVIVCAHFQTTDPVILGLTRGQHDDRHMGGLLVPAQLAAHLNPAGPFDHPVKDDEIGHIFACKHERIIAILGASHGIAFVLKAVFKKLGKGGIIFDKKQFGRMHSERLLNYGPAPFRRYRAAFQSQCVSNATVL